MNDIITDNEMVLHHCAIAVDDLEASIAWYEQMLGFSLLYRTEILEYGLKVAQMQGPGFALELFAAKDPLPVAKGEAQPSAGLLPYRIRHLGIGVKDAPGFVETLRAKGVEVDHIAEFENTYGAFILDNAGNMIEIWQSGTVRVPSV